MYSIPTSSHFSFNFTVHSWLMLASSYTSYTDFFHDDWCETCGIVSNPFLLTIVLALKFWNFAASAPASLANSISLYALSNEPSWFDATSAIKYGFPVFDITLSPILISILTNSSKSKQFFLVTTLIKSVKFFNTLYWCFYLITNCFTDFFIIHSHMLSSLCFK